MTADIEVEISNKVFLPVYGHLRQSDADVNFLWGGRDSGKSYFIAQKMLLDCLSKDYFRCVLIKKTFKSIRNSQYQTILELIEKWKLDHLFHFNKTLLEIHCLNGNKFLSVGCDDPENIKSIRNPSCAWFEECNQLSEEDYITVSTTLRSDQGKVQEWISFNPETDGDYKQFWLYKNWFSGIRDIYGQFTHQKQVRIPGEKKPVVITYTSTHTKYQDNRHCTPERQAKLEDLRETNPFYYQVYTLGKWGVRNVEHPFLFNFKPEKHVGKTTWNPSEITYLSFDFNKNPISACVFQMYGGHVYGIEAIKLPHSDIDTLCQVIDSRYPDALFIVTGDHSGYNQSALVKDDYNFYTAIQIGLRLNDTQIQVIRNPVIEENQVLMNKIMARVPVTFDEDNCAGLIFDCMFAEMLPSGKLKKEDRNDPAQQLDLFDCFVGETLISTPSGSKQIDQIKVGDFVMTRSGARPVVDRWNSMAEVWEFVFSDGTKILGTKDHRFYCHEVGFTPIFDLFKTGKSVWKKRSDTTAGVTQKTPDNIITTHQIRETQRHSTGRSGLIISDPSKADFMFTTKTAIRTITTSKIWSWLKDPHTCDITWQSGSGKIQNSSSSFKSRASLKHRSGTDLRRVYAGTVDTLKDSGSGIRILETGNATPAKRSTKEQTITTGFVQTRAKAHGADPAGWTLARQHVALAERHLKPKTNTSLQNFVPLNADQLRTHTEVKVVSARKIGMRKVFDISVNGEHEFYAEGILVHNCWRYFGNTIISREFIL